MNALNNSKELFHEYVLNKFVYGITNIIVWGYYYILLFKQTGSLLVLFQEALVFFTFVWVGFILGTFLLDKSGYLNAYRIAGFAQILTLIAMLVFINELGNLFIVFAIMRGLANGLYWPEDHSYSLKEMHGAKRGSIINIVVSISQVMGIVLPVLVGALLSLTSDYRGIFLIGIIVYLINILYPFKYNKKTKSKISSDEIKNILNKPYFGQYFTSQFLLGGFMGLFSVFFMIIPYILIKDELGVGGLASLVALVGAVITYFDRNISFKTKIVLGYIGSLIYMIFTMLFSIFWTVPMLLFRSLGLTFTTSFKDTIQMDLDYRIRELFLGNDKNESALEMNIITETAISLGRITVLMCCIVLFVSTDILVDIESVRVLIAVLSPYSLIIFIWQVWLYKKLRR